MENLDYLKNILKSNFVAVCAAQSDSRVIRWSEKDVNNLPLMTDEIIEKLMVYLSELASDNAVQCCEDEGIREWHGLRLNKDYEPVFQKYFVASLEALCYGN